MAFTQSALFAEASRQIQAAARQQFRQSDVGRMFEEVRRGMRSSTPSAKIRQTLQRYRRLMEPDHAIRQLMGSDFGTLCKEIQRYSRKDFASKSMVESFLGSLGPAGKMISALITPAKSNHIAKDLKTAMNLIHAFGGEVLPGKGENWSVADVNRSMAAAMKRLQEYGFALAGTEGPPRRFPDPDGQDVDMGMSPQDLETTKSSGMKHFPADHPILTGEMVPTPSSSEVYEFGYDVESAYLYVRFRKHPRDRKIQGGPGPLYRYSNVTPQEFLGLYAYRNMGSQGAYGSGNYGPGDWIWDVLRIRGTQSGHRKDYELVGIMDSYVPRKSTVRPLIQTIGKRGKPLKRPKRIGVEEWFEQRHVKTHEGRWVRSVLPAERVARVIGPR